MPRIRTIKPEFWSSPDVGKLELFDRLLFIALWSFADDEGRGRAIPRELAGFAFPWDDIPDDRITEGLRRLSVESTVTLYTVDGMPLFQITNWEKHQKVKNPSQSRLPAPPDPETDIPHPEDPPLPAVTESLPPVSGESTETLPPSSPLDLGPRKKDLGPRNIRGGLASPPAADEPDAPTRIQVLGTGESVPVEVLEPEPEQPSCGRARAPDPIWDVLVDVCGQVTSPQNRSRRGRCVRDIRSAFDQRNIEVTVENVQALCAAYVTAFPSCAVTDTALAKHADSLIEGKAGSRVADERDVAAARRRAEHARHAADIAAARGDPTELVAATTKAIGGVR